MSVPLHVDIKGRGDLLVVREWLERGDYESAGKTLGAYLLDYPEDPEAWYLMGRLLMAQDHYALAMMVYERLLDTDEGIKRFQNWWHLGFCYDHLNLHQKAESTYRKGLILHPDQENLLVSLGTHYVQQYRSREAEEILRRTLELYPNAQKARSSLGFALLQQRKWGEGWDEYHYGYGKLRSRNERQYGKDEPRWDGTKAKRARVIVHTEQGLGDQIAGLEPLADMARDTTVVAVEVEPKIRNLVARSYPSLDVRGTLLEYGIDWPLEKDQNCHAGCFMLHQHYRREESDYPGTPYLVADPERRIQWRALLDSLGPEPKIGIAWSGGGAITQKKARRAELTSWLPILKQPAHFVSLEYRDRTEDIEALHRRRNIAIHDWPRATMTEDYDDTAALVAELDLVIAVPTAVAHLAGALGVSTWVMVHERPNIHYTAGPNSEGLDRIPYYRDVRMWRRKDDDWVKVTNKIAKALEEWIGAREAA